jgi:hypothetical protein
MCGQRFNFEQKESIMNTNKRMAWIMMTAVMIVGTGLTWALPPPPPADNGGGIKPPDTPPPGKIYFEDNVVIVGPGFVKPDADAGTVYVDLTKLTPNAVNPDKTDPGKTVNQVVREVSTTKSQVEAAAVAIPRGLLDPASLMALLKEDDLVPGRGVFDDPAFLHEEVGSGEPAAPDRAEKARTGGAAVKAAPEAPAPAVRGSGVGVVIPSYWQLPIR